MHNVYPLRGGDMRTVADYNVDDLTVEGLYAELEEAKPFLRAWFFPSAEVVVRTSPPYEGPLTIHVFDFRAHLEPVITVLKKGDHLVVAYRNGHRFQIHSLKVFMKAVLEMHKSLPIYDPDAIKAPPGFCAQFDKRDAPIKTDYPVGDKE